MRIIKKYSNRRLYDTEASAYLNLEDLAAVIQRGEEVRVVDVKTGEDLTRSVLLQVIMEQEGGLSMLPVGLLHRVIRYSGPGQRLALGQLARGLELLDAQVTQLERQLGWWKPEPSPPPAARTPPEPEPEEADEAADAPADAASELDALRKRLADLESRLG